VFFFSTLDILGYPRTVWRANFVKQSTTADPMDIDPPNKPLPNGLQRGGVWFDDGNIMLIAENTAFRVYRGILTQKSEVFRDMFAVGRPSVSEAIDGCPFVHLTDTTKDLNLFLEVVVDGTTLSKRIKPVTWERVRAMMELGLKYQFDDIYQEGLARLTKWHPANLSGWQRVNEDDWGGEEADCISMANLAQKQDLPIIRAAALYRCCQLPSTTLSRHGDINSLSIENIQVCSMARANLIRSIFNLMTVLFGEESALHDTGRPDPADGQKQPANHQKRLCHAAYKRARRSTIVDSSIMVSSDPLASFTSSFFTTFGLCAKCDALYRDAHDAGRAEILGSLPSLFEL